MKADLPILMSAPMVQACVRECEEPGTGKTQTRRILKPQPFTAALGPGERYVTEEEFRINAAEGRVRSIRFAKGQRLWVKETHALPHAGAAAIKRHGRSVIVYKADEGVKHGRMKQYDGRWKPSIFMKREYSRLTLDVTDVRVERLQKMHWNAAAFRAEGVQIPPTVLYPTTNESHKLEQQFIALWDGINGAGAWDKNPWVAVIVFKPSLRNIDK